MKRSLLLFSAALLCSMNILADDCNTPTVSAATITFTYEEMPPEGVTSIKARFKVSANQWVYFSKGNLEYQASTNTWKFYETQLGCNAAGNSTSSGRSTQDKWIDIFGWGTGANPTGYLSSLNANSFKEWGYDYTSGKKSANNVIQNATPEDQWRTLTSSEWQYVFSRTNAQGHWLYAGASVSGTNGIIIFPDDWVMPAGCDFTIKYMDQMTDGTSWFNTLSTSQWQKLEEAGAIFLPSIRGIRLDNYVSESSSSCTYFTSSVNSNPAPLYIYSPGGRIKSGKYSYGNGYSIDYTQNYWAFAVRLVLPFTPEN